MSDIRLQNDKFDIEGIDESERQELGRDTRALDRVQSDSHYIEAGCKTRLGNSLEKFQTREQITHRFAVEKLWSVLLIQWKEAQNNGWLKGDGNCRRYKEE